MGPAREWTIEELAAQAALVLSEAQLGQPSGRVTDVPNPRTIRYYVTCGLLAPPARYRGRVALYGGRHLMQLVAIKRLQARGLSLVQVQERLAGLHELQLAQLAALSAPTATRGPAERAFWRQPPVDAPSMPSAPAVAERLEGLHLAPGVVMLLERAGRALDGEDREAIRVAAAPLVKLLATRRLLGGPSNLRRMT
jgi:DNA-binding transcriptional MerR regulator